MTTLREKLEAQRLGKIVGYDEHSFPIREQIPDWEQDKAETYRFKEKDPNGIDAKTPGAKLDLGKEPVWQGVLDYFPRAVNAVAGLSSEGASQYSWKGWESVDNGEARYRNALGRHQTKESIEGPWDLVWKSKGKDVLHLTAQAWNALAALELMLRRMEKENANAKS